MDSAVTGSRMLTIDRRGRGQPLTARVRVALPTLTLAFAVCSLSAVPPVGCRAASAADADLLDGLDAGRFPQRRRRGPLDRQRRPHVPRPGRVAASRETAAPFLWTVVAGADGTLWAGSGNEGKVLKIAQRRQGRRRSSTRRSWKCTRSRAAPQRRPVRRHLARRQDLPGRRRRHVEDVLRSRGQVHLGARGRCVRQRLRRHRRQGRHLQDHARRQGRALLQDRTRPTSCRSPSTKTGRADRRHRVAGARLPHRRGRARRSCCSTPRSARFTRCASPPTARIYAAALRRARRVIRCRSRRRARRGAVAPGRPSVSTEITAMPSWKARSSSSTAPSAGALARAVPAAARSTASGPTASGTRSGRRADDAPYDLIVEDGGQPARRHRARTARSSGCRGNPARATLLARAAARQVTALLREPSGRIVGATSNPGKLFALSSTRGAQGHLRVGRSRRRNRRHLGRHPLASHRRAPARCRSSRDRAIPPRRTRPGARGRTPTRTPRANASPALTRATSSGARR